jgi:dTDP-4-amino-4,6-dideoxygalactose transaminase
MVPIPLVDLQAQYHSLKGEIDEAIRRVLEGGQFVLGPEVEALEREVAAACGTAQAVGVASGTDALELALRAAGIGSGHEVLTTAYSFFATAEAVIAVGATPVFVDIEPESFTLDPALLASRITPRTKAIIPVHLYGHPCAMDRIMELAREHKLKVIEDCAQAIGAKVGGRPVGGIGHAGALSFYPTKNLGGCGDGGMVVTSDAVFAEQVRLLRAHGARERYRHLVIGRNSRLDELQAAVLRVKLKHLPEWTKARRARAERYAAAFQRSLQPSPKARGAPPPQRLEVLLPTQRSGCEHVYHLYAIRHPKRDAIQAALAKEGIETQVAYPSTLPAQPALAPWLLAGQAFPVAEAVALDVLALPVYPELTDEMIEQIVECVVRAVMESV